MRGDDVCIRAGSGGADDGVAVPGHDAVAEGEEVEFCMLEGREIFGGSGEKFFAFSACGLDVGGSAEVGAGDDAAVWILLERGVFGDGDAVQKTRQGDGVSEDSGGFDEWDGEAQLMSERWDAVACGQDYVVGIDRAFAGEDTADTVGHDVEAGDFAGILDGHAEGFCFAKEDLQDAYGIYGSFVVGEGGGGDGAGGYGGEESVELGLVDEAGGVAERLLVSDGGFEFCEIV